MLYENIDPHPSIYMLKQLKDPITKALHTSGHHWRLMPNWVFLEIHVYQQAHNFLDKFNYAQETWSS
jgi:hypothetical protein